jgi:hypothetical protein
MLLQDIEFHARIGSSLAGADTVFSDKLHDMDDNPIVELKTCRFSHPQRLHNGIHSDMPDHSSTYSKASR